jgi:hypothetical protein
MTTHITTSQLIALDFEDFKNHYHGDFMSQQWQKGKIFVKTTWVTETGFFVNQEVKIDAPINNVSKEELIFLDKIFNK